MGQVLFLERTVLEIAHDRVKLGHGVADRGAGGKDNAPAAGDLVHVAALHIKVAGFHGFGLADTADISHFGESGKVLVIMSFVDKNTINAQFLKGYNIVLSGLVVQLVELLFDRFLGALQLLD